MIRHFGNIVQLDQLDEQEAKYYSEELSKICEADI